MSNTPSQDAARKRINVGIYGDTRAGKTRFLFELLSGWNRNHRILWMSEMASRFLESVAIDIEQQGEPSPTSSQSEGIEADVRLSSETRVNFVLRDLRGGELARQIDTILVRNADHPRDSLQAQVKNYDAFLFFFDPTGSKTAKNKAGYYDRERKRALLFAEYVHRRRQNSYLPILFVATRKDLRDHDAEVQEKAQAWLKETCEQLRKDYESRLGRHYPPSLVQPDVVAIDVASTPQGNTEEVVERIVELVDDVRQFRRNDFRRVVQAVVLSLCVVALIAGVTYAIYWSTRGGPAENRRAGRTGPDTTEAAGPADAVTQLEEIESFLDVVPPGSRLSDRGQAEQLNQHLAWMLAAKETGEIGAGGPGGEPARRLDGLLARAGEVVWQASQSAAPTLESIELVSACLSDLPRVRQPPDKLKESYERFWSLYRLHVIDELGTVIRNQHEAGSDPVQILAKLTDRLDRFIHDIKLSQVEPLDANTGRLQNQGAALGDDLAVASQYCKNLLDNLGCTIKFQVARAAYQSKYGITPTSRRVVFHSQRQVSPLTVKLRPKAAAEAPGVARTDFEISPDTASEVKLALGSLGTLTMGILLKETQVWEDFHTVELRDLPTEGVSLAILGLPLVVKDDTRVRHALPVPEGYEIEVEFFGWHPPPQLLWDAVRIAEGG